MTRQIVHLVPGPDGHGVTRHALGLLADPALAHHARTRFAVGGPVDGALAAAADAIPAAALLHLHVTDHLLADSATGCAEQVTALGRRRPLSLTVHDLPQPQDADPARYGRRATAYAAMAGAAVGVVVSSEHERRLLRGALSAVEASANAPVVVIPLPLRRGRAPDPVPEPPLPRDLVVFGFLYPDKGHRAALAALAELPPDVGLLAAGTPAPGHAGVVRELHDQARRLGRRFSVTGYVAEAAVEVALRSAAVPVVPHRAVSASGSIGSWLSAGRRPLVPTGRYADEVACRCPGAVLRYGPGADMPDLPAAARAALADPRVTWLDRAVAVTPSPADCAQAYARVLAEWARP